MKTFKGKVVSHKMEKTAMVEVASFKTHPVYKKRIKVKRRFPSQDDIGVKVGQRVVIKEVRPISKTKKWQVIEVLEKKSQKKNTVKK